MRRLVGASLLAFAFVAVPCVELQAQKDKKKADKKKDAPAAVDSAKLSGEFSGTLKSTPGTDRIFVLTVETQKLSLPKTYNKNGKNGNNNSVNKIASLQNQLANDQRQIQTARTPQQRAQAMNRVQQHTLQLQQAIMQLNAAATKNGGLPSGVKVDTVKQDVEFQASETVKVRTMQLPESFDDKGSPKKYTKEEKDELKGKDKNAVGYESSLEKLEAGMKLRVALGAAPAKKTEKDKGKEDVDKDEMKDADKKMQVKTIVVLENAPASSGPAPKGKKGKK